MALLLRHAKLNALGSIFRRIRVIGFSKNDSFQLIAGKRYVFENCSTVDICYTILLYKAGLTLLPTRGRNSVGNTLKTAMVFLKTVLATLPARIPTATVFLTVSITGVANTCWQQCEPCLNWQCSEHVLPTVFPTPSSRMSTATVFLTISPTCGANTVASTCWQ